MKTMGLGIDGRPAQDDGDNITDWCLEKFQSHYESDSITKDDIWEYLYGVMHAPDWREKYKHDLQRNLPRLPLAADFEAFRSAGRQLMDLHIGYETVPEYQVDCMYDDEVDNDGRSKDPSAYRITGRSMRWGKGEDRKDDTSVLVINDNCRIVGIPDEAHRYEVSGRSPLKWAIEGLRHKKDKNSGIEDDPNLWEAWADDPYELVRHLRRLIYVSVHSHRIIDALPPSLADKD